MSVKVQLEGIEGRVAESADCTRAEEQLLPIRGLPRFASDCHGKDAASLALE
jgi:hypothetical protein